MNLSRIPILFGVIAGSFCAANATWYTSESDFLAALQGPFDHETFSSTAYGSNPSNFVSAGLNGFNWNATPANGMHLFELSQGLSVEAPGDGLLLTFTGHPVTAFGAFLTTTGNSGNDIVGTEKITFNNDSGFAMTISTPPVDLLNPKPMFLGWVGNTVLTSASITSNDPANYIAMRTSAYTGGDAPEPFTMGLGIAGVGLFIRRRVKAKARLQAA